MSNLPPPPPPPAVTAANQPNNPTVVPAPAVPPAGPPSSVLVHLLIYNGYPFKDHWAYFVQSRQHKHIGVKIHATGDVRTGFIFEVKRNHNLEATEDIPTKVVPLQWVDGALFDEATISGDDEKEEAIDNKPVGEFEEALYKVDVPGKSLVGIDDVPREGAGRKVTQRDCQTWIVESADQLVKDGIFKSEVVDYLRAAQQ
ncbi:uncharacterized protein APUU_40506S [Aspergillus puulaauensis]|uniref:Uncharacterized protein n=1 Tax=Aspergillus puulaauensis TaxID=1220207 RepID=A0A7R7XMU9_9EURO|nr:uncharacterized protein APUU_40506S [Aspergillus puulaauensis]BCS24062.1 hypothetical protein APUU_40506S [Aspergillus puulaauensis]